MLDVACLFFDKDVSAALLDLNKLYLQHSNLDEHKDSIDKQVDEILSAAQDPDSSEETLHNIDASNQSNTDDLANIQKDLEALIQQDDHIKQRMVPVMHCMQYEDLVINRMQRLIICWEFMVSLLNSTKQIDISSALQTFDGFLSSEDEHQKFYKHVLQIDYQPFDDHENHEISHVEHNIDSLNTFLERLFEFSQDSLNNCIDKTQHAFDELMSLLNIVTGESDDVAYLFADKSESLADIHNILDKHKEGTDVEARKLIKEIEATRSKHSEEASALIQSFMMALQSQDCIRQNIENIGRLHHLWRTFRVNIINSDTFDGEQCKEFGNETMSRMTSHIEREIIEKHIPGAGAGCNEDDDVSF